jgi:ELWxxDGT repeat protein
MIRRPLLCLALTAFAFAGTAVAQPYLLRDIQLAPPPVGTTVGPTPIAATPSRAIFLAGTLAGELWGTDGTATGTVRLPLELDPFDAPRVGTVAGRMILRQGSAHDGDGPVLWSTDGTPAGTERLTFHVSRGAEVHPVAVLGGELLVSLGGPAGGELWATDGTLTGTRMVRDLRSGPVSSDPRGGAVAGGVVLFPASGEGTGRELWRTDGTAEGTVPVADLRPGPAGSLLERFASFGTRVLFVADDGVTGTELWISDGTAAGTRRVVDLDPGADPTTFLDGPRAAPDGGFAYFVADLGDGPELWRTDGTAAGTLALSPELEAFDLQYGLLFTGGRVVFVASTADHGYEPWISDGTVAGTHPVDLCPGPCSSHPSGLAPSSRGVIFLAEDQGDGDVYRSDGTVAGTYAFADLCDHECQRFRLLGEGGGRLILVTEEFGDEALWASAGTPGDAMLLRQGDVFDNAVGGPMGEIDDRLLFVASDEEHGSRPWRTDGTPGGTEPITDLPLPRNGSSGPSRPHRVGDALLFVARDGDFLPLWRTDGTIAGTEQVARLVLHPDGGTGEEGYRDFALAGDRLFFGARPGVQREQRVWSTDGTSAGTAELLRMPEGSLRLTPIGDEVLVLGPELWRAGQAPGSARRLAEIWCTSRAARAGSRWVFGATQNPGGESNRELWVTDGSAAGTRRLKDILPGLESSDPGEPLSFRGRAWFAARDAEHGRELWSSDGTEAGTRMLRDLQPGGAAASPRPLAVLGGRLLFSAHGPGGFTLWSTDGTPAGTIDLGPPAPGFFVQPAVVGGALYWFEDGALWRSDGTPGSGREVADLLPSTVRLELAAAVGDRLVLSVTGFLGGTELWLSDGTPEGTRRAVDGDDLGLTSLRGLGIVGDVLVFSGFDREIGQEPWAAHLGDRPGPFTPPAAPSALTAEPVSPTAVRLTWRDHAPDEERFRIEVTTLHGPAGGPLLHPADTLGSVVGGLTPGVPASFRVRAENSLGPSAWSGEASATPQALDTGPCAADDRTLCLLGGRFALRAAWRDQRSGDTGNGHAVPYPGSDRTGTFWFFDPANVELIAKALDGRPVNGAFWSFFGGLSDTEYWVTVTDTVDQRSRTYHNPPGEICGVGDTTAFPGAAFPVAAPAAEPASATRPAAATPLPQPGLAGACVPGPQTLCLLDGRLQVEVAWNDHHNGGSGPGRALPGTDKTGYFWFFDPDNVELVVKALDGTGVNGHLWVFWGALTDVEYTITVTDTENGLPVEYHNPPGEICGGADTAAF